MRVPEIFIRSGINGLSAPGSGVWRHWVVGTVTAGQEHLVITASPRPLNNDARVVNGPAWYPQARVRRVTSVTIKGWRMRVVSVPREWNDGSAFADHVVLIWTLGKHTYGVGFHDNRGVPETLRLNKELARHIALLGP